MDRFPLISVVIPCYNHAQYISHALDAVLAQTYPNLEIIVVDDYSTDDIDVVIAPYLEKYDHIQCLKNEYGSAKKQSGFYGTKKNTDSGWAARNFGVDHAKGEYITFQDADDGSYANRIEVQYQLIKKYDSHHVVVDWCAYTDERNTQVRKGDMDDVKIWTYQDIAPLVKRTKKGIWKQPFSKKEEENNFWKCIHKIDRKFFHDWTSFPAAGSMPLVKREVFEQCRFRPLYERTRPSLRGRGTDQDFNFWVAETFQDSIVAFVPLVLWRCGAENERYTSQ